MVTRVARQTPVGARPNKRREAVLLDQDAAGRPLENAGDCVPREMTVRSLVLRQNPAYRLGDSLPSLGRLLVVATVAVLALASCRGPVPRQPVSPQPLPSPPARVEPSFWTPAPDNAPLEYVFEQHARFVTVTDSGTLSDSGSLIVEASVRTTPTGELAGLIRSATVEAPGSSPASISGLAFPFAFGAPRPAVGTQPAPMPRGTSIADPCRAPFHVPLSALRDLIPALPDSVFLGHTWTDSGTYATCRDGAPLSVHSVRTFRLVSYQPGVDGGALHIDRTSRLTIRGFVVRGDDTTYVDGSGSGMARVIVSARSGAIVSSDGTSTVEIVVRGVTKSERAQQNSVSRAYQRLSNRPGEGASTGTGTSPDLSSPLVPLSRHVPAP